VHIVFAQCAPENGPTAGFVIDSIIAVKTKVSEADVASSLYTEARSIARAS